MAQAHITAWLARAHPAVFTMVAGTAGFAAYFAMYAFRKPFTAAAFDHVAGWPFSLDYKIALIIAQVAGYALSKIIGVKVVAEIAPHRRAGAILMLIGLAWAALIAFAALPAVLGPLALFVNGAALGMIWGLVYGFMEGRRVTEALAAMMCASFIVSSGVVKSVGASLMLAGLATQTTMPAMTGALFVPVLLASVWVLVRLPPPSPADEAARVHRAPMDGPARRAFMRDHAPGLALIIFAYVLLTAFRDFRDNFAAELWVALGHGREPGIFSASEVPVAVLALTGMALVIRVKDNARALIVIHAMVAGGFVLLGLATLAFAAGWISALWWMILAGSGLYVAYNPINAVLFDRMVAASGRVANAGFLIYLADSFGYAGSVALLLWRNLMVVRLDWLQFFITGAYVTSVVGTLATALAAVWFWRHDAKGRR